jgi:hypothetical protein
MILRKRATALRSLWDQVLEIANQGWVHRPQFLSPSHHYLRTREFHSSTSQACREAHESFTRYSYF